VKGGALANPHDSVKKVLKEANPDASLASWAIRFVASLDGMITVLSGMSNIEQMQDNLSYMEHFKPLDEKEQDAIRKAQEALGQIKSIPCTACHYCTDGCPMQINIPKIFSAMNKKLIWGQIERAKSEYNDAISKGGKASACIGCGQCERACPQHIKIIDELKTCAATFE
nr:4Fe-4S dicluster domain-containing protein [Butyrivibrio sp.]